MKAWQVAKGARLLRCHLEEGESGDHRDVAYHNMDRLQGIYL